MKNHFELGVRLLALYYLMILMQGFISMSYLTINSLINSEGYYYSSMWAMSVINIIIIAIIFVKPQFISKLLRIKDNNSDITNNINNIQLLRIGIILIGLLYFIGELFYLIDDVSQYPSKVIADRNDLISFSIRRVLSFGFSMMMMYKSDSIATFLFKSRETNS